MKRLEQNWRIDVAFMVRAEDNCRSRHMFQAAHPVTNSGQGQRQPGSEVAQPPHRAPPSKHSPQEQREGGRNDGVGQDQGVGNKGADGGDGSQPQEGTEKRPDQTGPGGRKA